jgi:hypothetical protein
LFLIGRQERLVDANNLLESIVDEWLWNGPAVQVGTIHETLDRFYFGVRWQKTRSSPGVSNKEALIISRSFPVHQQTTI